MAASLGTRIAEQHAEAAASLPGDVVGRERRRSAIEILALEGLPTTRDENWKYANLRPLDKVRFAPLPEAARKNLTALSPVKLTDLPPAVEGYARYVFVDGVFVPALSAAVGKNGITVSTRRDSESATSASEATASARHAATAHSTPTPAGRPASAPAATSGAPAKNDARFALLNDAFATDRASIRVAAGTD